MLRKLALLPIVALAGLAACSTGPSLDNGGGNTVSGSAAGTATNNANGQLAHCPRSYGTAVINEDRDMPWYAELTTQFHLPSTIPLIRLMAQQSNCFVVVDRANGLTNEMGEQQLSDMGMIRSRGRHTRGQMVSADYTITPSINFSQQGGSGLSGALGFIPGVGGLLSTASGGVQSNNASTTLMLTDNRSSVQIAAAQGSAHNWDFGGLGGLFGSSAGGRLGGYGNSPRGRLIAAGFMDAFNQMVASLANYHAQSVQGGLGNGGTLGVGQ